MLTLPNFQMSLALQSLRERCEFSAEDLATRAGLPHDAVNSIEAGEIGLDYLTAARLTNVMQVSLAEIAATAFTLDPVLVRQKHAQMVARCRGQAQAC